MIEARVGNVREAVGRRNGWLTIDGNVDWACGDVGRVVDSAEAFRVLTRIGRDVRVLRGVGTLPAAPIAAGATVIKIASA